MFVNFIVRYLYFHIDRDKMFVAEGFENKLMVADFFLRLKINIGKYEMKE